MRLIQGIHFPQNQYFWKKCFSAINWSHSLNSHQAFAAVIRIYWLAALVCYLSLFVKAQPRIRADMLGERGCQKSCDTLDRATAGTIGPSFPGSLRESPQNLLGHFLIITGENGDTWRGARMILDLAYSHPPLFASSNMRAF